MISNSAILFEDEEPELDFKLDEIMWSTYGFMPCKDIIFVFAGDNNQLPPLKHDYCPALDADYLNKRYGIEGSVFTLEKVYRQSKESEISKIAKYFTSKTDNTSLKIPSLKEIEDSVQIVQESDIVRLFFELYFCRYLVPFQLNLCRYLVAFQIRICRHGLFYQVLRSRYVIPFQLYLCRHLLTLQI